MAPIAKKMKVRMKVSIASADFAYQPNQVVLLEVERALQWVAVGHAERVGADEPLTEAATLQTNEFMIHDPRILHRIRGGRVA